MFMQLLGKHQAAIRSYIRPLLHTSDDIDDVMQNASVAAWNKYNELKDETGFHLWMGSIARFEALNFRRRYAKQKLTISDDIIFLIADEMSETEPRDERVYLDACLEKLPHMRRALILQAYSPDNTIEDLAKNHGRSRPALYQLLSRIRQELSTCLRLRLGVQPGHD